jgi:dihydrofolate reductase
MVHSVVLGNGKRLFDDGDDRKALVLVDSKSFATGDHCLKHQPPQT